MPTIISDIDGTLISLQGNPIQQTIDFLAEESDSHTIVIVTARQEARRVATAAALSKAGAKYDRLLMNKVGPSHEEGLKSKEENAKKLSNVVLAIENDADARAVYENLGITTSSPSGLSDIDMDEVDDQTD